VLAVGEPGIGIPQSGQKTALIYFSFRLEDPRSFNPFDSVWLPGVYIRNPAIKGIEL
jgi:hypothetical protein